MLLQLLTSPVVPLLKDYLAELILIVIMFWRMCRNPLAQMEEEKRDHEAKMKKMESEMEQVFEMKVREKKQKLKDSEADVS